MRPDEIEKIAVLGAGVMGHGIAQVASVAGYTVAVRDIKQTFLDNGYAGIEKSLNYLVKREKITLVEKDEILSRITFTLDLKEAVEDAQLVIEAIPERMEIKHLVWKEVTEYAKQNAILATNTSSLSITEIAEAVNNPERFIGMHFFNPPVIMKLVEVNQGEKTSEETVETIIEISKKMGKTPVWVKKDSPGFIVNRILITYLNEASKLLENYEMKQIDAAMQHKAGMPLGPFMLSDLIGLDIVYNILKTFEEKIGSDYKPHKKIQELFESKKLGRKTGEGFYSYEDRPKVTEEEGKGFDIKLLLKPLVEEAEKLLKEEVASTEDIDLAMKLGANIPRGPSEIKKSGFQEEKPVITEKTDGIYTITLNRPGKLNSMTMEMLSMISEAISDAEKDPSVKAIVITGAGDRAFCAGSDISAFPSMTVKDAKKLSTTGQSTYKKLLNIPKPVIAAINGYCLGGGNELTMFCDFRLASETARFSQPEVNLGLIPGWGGTYMLRKLVGKTIADELCMTGKRIKADEAKKIGLVTEVYPAAEFKAKVKEYAQTLVNSSPLSLRALKKLSNRDPQLETALEAEAEAFSNLWNYNDLQEGIDAFNNRRKPVFKGK